MADETKWRPLEKAWQEPSSNSLATVSASFLEAQGNQNGLTGAAAAIVSEEVAVSEVSWLRGEIKMVAGESLPNRRCC